LKHTAAVTDLSGNPWKCECSALGEAWRELRHKLTLNCASPEDRRGRTWDVIEGDLCNDTISFVKLPDSDKLNVSSGANPNITTWNVIRTVCRDRGMQNGSSDANTNITTDTGPALCTTMFVVNGVLVACTLVGGGFIAVQLMKKLRKRMELSEHNEVSIALTETGSSVRVSSRLSLRSTDATGHVYETID
jgi:hypothetical protein